jgi:hypothetical protein
MYTYLVDVGRFSNGYASEVTPKSWKKNYISTEFHGKCEQNKTPPVIS